MESGEKLRHLTDDEEEEAGLYHLLVIFPFQTMRHVTDNRA